MGANKSGEETVIGESKQTAIENKIDPVFKSNVILPEDSNDLKLDESATDILEAFLVKLISLPIGFISPSSQDTYEVEVSKRLDWVAESWVMKENNKNQIPGNLFTKDEEKDRSAVGKGAVFLVPNCLFEVANT